MFPYNEKLYVHVYGICEYVLCLMGTTQWGIKKTFRNKEFGWFASLSHSVWKLMSFITLIAQLWNSLMRLLWKMFMLVIYFSHLPAHNAILVLLLLLLVAQLELVVLAVLDSRFRGVCCLRCGRVWLASVVLMSMWWFGNMRYVRYEHKYTHIYSNLCYFRWDMIPQTIKSHSSSRMCPVKCLVCEVGRCLVECMAVVQF